MIGLGIAIPKIAVNGTKGSLESVIRRLFANGEPGAWYDPSDLSTLFQDAAGTTPVTAVEQPVGLILDKSKGGRQVLGVTGWTVTQGAGVYSISENVITVTSVSSMLYVHLPTSEWAIGDFAEIEITAQSVTGTCLVYLGGVPQAITNGQKTYRIIVSSNNLCRLVFASGASGVFTISSRAKTPGNHATQTTSTSRPVLSARYNLLTKTEQFDDAVWTKNNATVTANAAVAPDGTITADKLVENTAAGLHYVEQPTTTISGTAYTGSVYVKAGERSWARLQFVGSAYFPNIYVNLADGSVGKVENSPISYSVTDVGQGWYRISMSAAVDSASTRLRVYSATANNTASYTGDGTSGIYIWGASIVPANQSSLPYQRVNTATDYDAGPAFPRYLRCDGIDDWMVTGTITPGTDKAQVFAGVRKIGTENFGTIAELGLNSSLNPGGVSIFGPGNGPNNYRFRSAGSVIGQLDSPSAYAPPVTNVITGLGDISGDLATLRIDGDQVAQSTEDQGTGNYLAYPLYLFRRGGTSLPFNGHFYGAVIRFGPNLPIETIQQTEAWMNSKTQAIDWRDVTDSSSFRWNSATASPDAE